MSISAYPLSWPEGWARTKGYERTWGKFSKNGKTITVAAAVDRVRAELKRMGLNDDDVIVSTNIKLRLDGLPRGDQSEPFDPGVAVYFESKKGNKVMAIDSYARVADNLAAIERHGGAEILDRAFTGFAALPAPGQSKSWRDVLGFPPGSPISEPLITDAFRRAAAKAHPDRGGSTAAMQEVNAARDAALKEIGR